MTSLEKGPASIADRLRGDTPDAVGESRHGRVSVVYTGGDNGKPVTAHAMSLDRPDQPISGATARTRADALTVLGISFGMIFPTEGVVPRRSAPMHPGQEIDLSTYPND